MECLKLVSFVLDLPQFLQGMNCILKHMHLLLRMEVDCHVNQGFIKSNLLLPVESHSNDHLQSSQK